MALTWRNVDAPDFRGALDGLRTFGDLFSGGLNTLDKSLGAYDATKNQDANNSFMLNALKLRDPAALDAALKADPTLGVAPGRITTDSIKFATDQASALRSNAVTDQNLKVADYGYNQTVAKDLLANVRLAAEQLARDGKRTEAVALLDQNKELIAKAGFAAAGEVSSALGSNATANLSDASTVANTARTIVGTAGDRLNQRVTQNNLDMTIRDDRDRQSAFAALSTARQMVVPGDNESVSLALNDPRFNGLSAGAKNLLFTELTGSTGMNPFAPSSTAGGAGGDPTRAMNYEARASGINSVPDSVKTLGDASNFALTVNAANKARTGENGSSAMGVYQIVGQTLRGKDGDNGYAKKALGADWKNQPYNFENQDKIAQAIFNDNKGSASALRKQWTSIKSDADAERIRNMPWEQARQIIAQGESGGNPSALAAQSPDIARFQLAEAAGRNNATGIGADYGSTIQDNTPIGDVTDKLMATTFKGVPRGTILGQVRRIMTEGNTNAATAAAVLTRNIREQDSGLEKVSRRFAQALSLDDWIGNGNKRYTSNLANGQRLNDAGIASDIQELKKGRTGDRTVANMSLGSINQQITVAQTNAANARAKLSSAVRAAATGQGSMENVRRLQAEANATTSRLQDLLNEATVKAPRPATAEDPASRDRPTRTWSDLFSLRSQ